MKTRDLFTNNRSAKKINESIQKIFGRKLNLENFDLAKLEDARNKLRTQLHTERSKAGFNETIENEALTQAQWMLDTINAEIAERQQFIADAEQVQEQADTGNNESIETGDDMKRLQEGEIQQASAIVTAKTMVDRVGRWIEELSGMENDTLLQLGDSIRDEMGQEQAKQFISVCAPAIQQALESLKATRETLASGVRTLTGEEQAAGMLGATPDETGMDAAAPDAMNPEPDMGDDLALEPEADEFAASDAAVGGAETAGREKRESIDYGNRLLKVLAG